MQPILIVTRSYLYLVEKPTWTKWDINPNTHKPQSATMTLNDTAHDQYLDLLSRSHIAKVYFNPTKILNLYPPSVYTSRIIELYGPDSKPSNLTFLDKKTREFIRDLDMDPSNEDDLIEVWTVLERIVLICNNDPDFDNDESLFKDEIPINSVKKIQRAISNQLSIKAQP